MSSTRAGDVGTPNIGATTTPRTLHTASVVIGLLAVSVGVVGASAALSPDRDEVEVGEPTRSYELGPVTVDVNAHTFWRETLDALRCYERHGLSTYGPYPSADGRNIEYAVEATESSEEIEEECLAMLMPLGMRFASEAPVVEAEKLIELSEVPVPDSFLEQQVGVPVRLVGVGPGREQFVRRGTGSEAGS